METPVRVIKLHGFDPAGEPEIRVMDDGTLCVLFEAMPPDNATPEEEALFAHFDREMERAAGVAVAWDDRERLRVPAPREDTVERIAAFVGHCRHEARAAGGRKSLRRRLMDVLAGILEPAGFRFRQADEGFARSIPGGRQVLFVSWVSRGADNDFGLTVGIRLDAVEALVFPDSPPAQRGKTLTTMTQLEHFGLEPELGLGVRFRVAGPEDVAAAVDALKPIIERQVLPFLERYRDVRSLDLALNAAAPAGSGLLRRLLARAGRPRAAADDAWAAWLRQRRAFDSSGQPYRAMHALAVAHLAGSTRFEVLARQHTRDLPALQDADRRQLDDLVARLRAARGGG